MRTGSRARFLGNAYTLLILLTGTNLATPLYRGYQSAFGYPPLTTTLIFAVYVTALIPTLLLAGSLADALGPRRVVLPALGTLAFAFAENTGWLFAARILQGLAIGAASGALTAAIGESEPRGNQRTASLVATAASVGGLGLGPLLSGALAQYTPLPHLLPFLVELVLLIPAAFVAHTLPSTGTGARLRPALPRLPGPVRAVFFSHAAAVFLAFAVLGLFLSLVPAYLGSLSGSTDLLLTGATVALLPAGSALAQLSGTRLRAVRPERAGLPLLAAGLGALLLAGNGGWLTLLCLAAVVAGIGHGLIFLGALRAITAETPLPHRAEVFSAFYVVVYLGVGLPTVGVGLLSTALGLLGAVECFAGLAAVASLLLLIRLPGRRTAAARTTA